LTDVLNRLKWDEDLDLSQYVVGYLERFAGIREMPVRNWISEPTEEEWIPQHRIRYFKKIRSDGEREIVWDRDTRIDNIFNSGTLPTSASRNVDVDVVSDDGGVVVSS
jgi:uncharacterized protein (UPF0248 family)